MKTYANSGATTHCFRNKHAFVEGSIVPCEERIVVLVDNTSFLATQWGEVPLEFDSASIRLEQALFISLLVYSLFPTGRLADNGVESQFRRHDVVLERESNKSVIGYGTRDLDSIMYVLSAPFAPESCAVLSNIESPEGELWNRLLAHINNQGITRVYKFVDDVSNLRMLYLIHTERAKLGKLINFHFRGILKGHPKLWKQSTWMS